MQHNVCSCLILMLWEFYVYSMSTCCFCYVGMPLSDYLSSLKDNQFFGAGFGLVGVGAFLAIARKGSQYAFSMFQRYGLTTLEITSRDKSYQWLLQWINAQGQRTQHLSVQTAFYQVCFVDFGEPSMLLHTCSNQSEMHFLSAL